LENTKFFIEEIDDGQMLNDILRINFNAEEFDYPFTKNGEFLHESKATPYMIEHLKKNLDLDQNYPNYRIVDVHNKKSFSLQTPEFQFLKERKGKPDAIIVPKNVSDDDMAKCFCVGFEFKTPATIDSGYYQLIFQVIGSLKMRNKCANLPFLLVKTDLETFTFYYLGGPNKINSFTTKVPTYAMFFIKHFLNNYERENPNENQSEKSIPGIFDISHLLESYLFNSTVDNNKR